AACRVRAAEMSSCTSTSSRAASSRPTGRCGRGVSNLARRPGQARRSRARCKRAPPRPAPPAACWRSVTRAARGGSPRAAGAEGARLQTSARLDDLTLAPPSHAFTLTGLSGQVSGGERELVAELDSRAARLELARAPQYPLQDVRLAARLRISRTERGWQVGLQQLAMQHERARLRTHGAL